MREGKAARLPNYAGRVTIVDTNRPYTMRRAETMKDHANAEVVESIKTVRFHPVPQYAPLGGE